MSGHGDLYAALAFIIGLPLVCGLPWLIAGWLRPTSQDPVLFGDEHIDGDVTT